MVVQLVAVAVVVAGSVVVIVVVTAAVVVVVSLSVVFDCVVVVGFVFSVAVLISWCCFCCGECLTVKHACSCMTSSCLSHHPVWLPF